MSSFYLDRLPEFRRADIIHLHVIHSGYFNYLALPHLTKRKPAVLTMHDMWSLTGHCAYSYDCEKWRSGCGPCPYPKIEPPIRRDATRWEWLAKRRVYRKSRLAVAAPSAWLAGLAREGLPGQCGIDIRQIPAGLNTERFAPRDRRESKASLGLDPDIPLLLVVAANLRDRRKGFDLFADAMKLLRARQSLNFNVSAMGGGEGALSAIGGPVLYLGYLNCVQEKQIAYSAADVVVVPSRADNQPCVILEAMACGTPCVAFDVGGIPEVVKDGETGFLARSESAEDLARALEEALSNPGRTAKMGQNARAQICSDHDLLGAARRYLNLYNELLNRDTDELERPMSITAE